MVTSLMRGGLAVVYEEAGRVEDKLKQMELDKELARIRAIAVQRAVLGAAEAALSPVSITREICLCNRSKIERLIGEIESYSKCFDKPISKDRARLWLPNLANCLFTLLEEEVEISFRDLSFLIPHLSTKQRYALHNENLFRPLYVHYCALRSINTEYDREGSELAEIKESLLTKEVLDLVKKEFSLQVQKIVLDAAKKRKRHLVKEELQLRRNQLDKAKRGEEIAIQKEDDLSAHFYKSYTDQKKRLSVCVPSPLALSVLNLSPGQIPLNLKGQIYPIGLSADKKDRVLDIFVAQSLGVGHIQASHYKYKEGKLKVWYSFYLEDREIPICKVDERAEIISTERMIEMRCIDVFPILEEIDLAAVSRQKIVALREEIKEKVAPALREWQKVWSTIVGIAADYFGETLPSLYPFISLDPDKDFAL
jgi:hypothetical protein